MYLDVINKLVNASKAKVKLLENNPIGYFLASCLAGVYVGLGIILIFTIGGHLSGLPYAKIVMGISFGIALSLVLMAGSELFTGNNLIMGVSSLVKAVPWPKTLKLWVVCYLGNWVGSITVAVLFYYSGLNNGAVAQTIANVSLAKMSASVPELIVRGILCNLLVCLAVWCYFKLENEVAKLVMIFWCLFAFITSGFEHSIANMTLLTIGVLEPLETGIELSGYFYNILVVSAGNVIGAFMFLVIPYVIISKERN